MTVAQHPRRLWRIIRRAALLLLSCLLAITALVGTITAKTEFPGEGMTSAGIRQSSSTYIRMRDGVEIAVTVTVPIDLKPGERLPVLMRTTRYWRLPQIGWGMRAMAALHLIDPRKLADQQRAYFNQRRFVVMAVDARGSGASGGNRFIELSPAEVADMGEVAAWAARQPWSNGLVGTYGVSYEGDTAEMAAVSLQPAIRALMPLYNDFDVQALFQPGGVTFSRFVRNWGSAVKALDHNDLCATAEIKGWECWKLRQMIAGVRRVDTDPHGNHLRQLLAQRHDMDVAASLSKAQFRDDSISTPVGEFSWSDVSPYGHRAAIEVSKAPMMVWCGWLDAGTCEGALIRYRTFHNSQLLIIGPLSHGGGYNVDPFAAAHTPPVPAREDQYRMEADFMDGLLRRDAPQHIESSIHYYTMGEGGWHTTDVWPPPGLNSQRLYLSEHNSLRAKPPIVVESPDRYTVDFTASSGNHTRWHTQLGGDDVVYPDRSTEDRKLLVYTGEPLENDLEITGSPVVTLQISSTAGDGAIHAYLEDVSPQGRATYLDEGIFRVIHRKEVDSKDLPYQPLGPAHSFLRADAEPFVPGQPAIVRFSLYPTSVLLRKGHRIRLALAGADAGLFQRYPAEGTPVWTIYHEPHRASLLELPVRTR